VRFPDRIRNPGLCLCIAVFAAGCASTHVPAPIVDRSPRPVSAAQPAAKPPAPAPVATVTPAAAAAPSKSPQAPAQDSAPRAANPPVAARSAQPVIRPYREGDWRPEYYVVQKGDTLYSVALDHGQDYRDVAAWNQLADPSYIQVGQQLRMFPPGGSADPVALEPVALPPASLPAQAAAAPATAPARIPLYSEPKARRLAYSDAALAQLSGALSTKPAPGTAAGATAVAPPPVASPPAATTAAAAPPAAPPAAPKSVQAGIAGLPDERVSWERPTKGALTYGFGKGSNQKGVGFEGSLGQPVVASAPGKVVYSGSGLRGYGKLIIIKHNPTYLSVYAHNSQLLVKEGQAVAQGQKIAEMGDTDSDRVGLHFEIRRLGKPTDPLKYLPDKPS
jgi:lipoprotein NlpD